MDTVFACLLGRDAPPKAGTTVKRTEWRVSGVIGVLAATRMARGCSIAFHLQANVRVPWSGTALAMHLPQKKARPPLPPLPLDTTDWIRQQIARPDSMGKLELR